MIKRTNQELGFFFYLGDKFRPGIYHNNLQVDKFRPGIYHNNLQVDKFRPGIYHNKSVISRPSTVWGYKEIYTTNKNKIEIQITS
jgi:hypothetical protein